MRQASFRLRNLRAVLIILILSFHSFSAYIVSQPAETPPFDRAPYDWIAFPIVDSARWLGFDLYCAFQFLYLMQFMFLLSGLFVWQSLLRRGWRAYLRQRLVRLGVPFLIGTYALMPLAYYASYRATAVDPSWSSFWSHWIALPVTATGPMWFLWFLLALNVAAVALYRLWPGSGALLTFPLLAKAKTNPGALFLAIVGVSAIAYLPLSAFYSPWKWVTFGPFEVQAALAPQYVLYFAVGLALGAYGYDRGLLDADGILVKRWPLWAAGSLAGFMLWIIPTALIVKGASGSPALLRLAGDLGLVVFSAATCFAMMAVFLRYAAARWPAIDSISENAYSIYFFHYPLVLWLQFALLGANLPAIVKALIVFLTALLVSWGASVVTNRAIANARLLMERAAASGPSPTPSGRVTEGNFRE
jgi:glucans biosynthesis protein C